MTNGRGANNLYDSNDKGAIYDSNDRWANLKLCFSQEWMIHWFRHSLWVESLDVCWLTDWNDSLWVSDGYWINPSCQCGSLTQTSNHRQLPSTWRTQQHTNTKTAGVYNTFKHLNYPTEVELLLINYTATAANESNTWHAVSDPLHLGQERKFSPDIFGQTLPLPTLGWSVSGSETFEGRVLCHSGLCKWLTFV